ncbi:hypothetical protein Aau02nite_49550 [Amorphoplanes auranticolor]|uniref:Uncharacterized protein n=1 Tax=Actinoplanes auranticolor TaxID=47988 RepID=A0A919SG96_9ACTN|nr:hypothetical protein Aau02nite_49550 [Actinoplanes auranticolor]
MKEDLVNAWIALAVVLLIALVIFVPSAEPTRRAETLIRAWKRGGSDNAEGNEVDGATVEERPETPGSIGRGDSA